MSQLVAAQDSYKKARNDWAATVSLSTLYNFIICKKNHCIAYIFN